MRHGDEKQQSGRRWHHGRTSRPRRSIEELPLLPMGSLKKIFAFHFDRGPPALSQCEKNGWSVRLHVPPPITCALPRAQTRIDEPNEASPYVAAIQPLVALSYTMSSNTSKWQARSARPLTDPLGLSVGGTWNNPTVKTRFAGNAALSRNQPDGSDIKSQTAMRACRTIETPPFGDRTSCTQPPMLTKGPCACSEDVVQLSCQTEGLSETKAAPHDSMAKRKKAAMGKKSSAKPSNEDRCAVTIEEYRIGL